MPAPVNVKVWKKLATGWGWVTNLDTLTAYEFEWRSNGPGPWSLSLPVGNEATKITAARMVTFDYAGQRFTGVPEILGAAADAGAAPAVTISGTEAHTILGDSLAWPAPSAALGLQGTAYYTATGFAETVLRDMILANVVTRRGNELAIPASTGRGATITVNERFSNLLAVVLAKAQFAGLGVRMGLVDTTSSTRAEMQLTFTVPADKSNRVRLSHKAGTLGKWEQSDGIPTATRAIVGGSGMGAARVFRSRTATTAETTWARSREVFVDARDSATAAVLDQRGDEALNEATGTSAFQLAAVEATGMRYGTHYTVGDKVRVELTTGLSTVQPVGAVKVSQSVGQGVAVQITPGAPDGIDPLLQFAGLVRGLRRQVKSLEREV